MNQQNSQKPRPFVSVIIPFFNNHDEVVRIEKNMRQQSYPPDRFETIFIDNGSTKVFKLSESFLARNTVLKESQYLNSPYSARNRGIEVSKGNIIAFIDANSVPDKEWLEEGVMCLSNLKYDLAGGNVQFDFQEKVTAGKIVDALTSINIEKAIKERGVAYTANLFVKKQVFETIGDFEEGIRSGGDVRWTMRAKENGYKITYCENAIVKKFARSARELYRKKIRTGRGYYYSWKLESEKERTRWYYNFFRSLKPPSYFKIRKLNPNRYEDKFENKLAMILFHLYISGILEQISFMKEYITQKFGGDHSR